METSRDCNGPEMKERAHYLAWLTAALLTSVLLGLTLDLLAVRISGGNVGNEIVPLLYASVIVPPYVFAWRKHGEANCRFAELEHALDTSLDRHPVWRSRLFEEVLGLIERIDQARGMTRQAVRNEAKAWLAAHGHALSREERQYVTDHLGYLHHP